MSLQPDKRITMRRRERAYLMAAVCIAWLLGVAAMAQLDNLKIEEPEPAPEPQQKLIRVSSLNSIEANREFQRNVQILQAQRQRAVELSAAIDTARTEGEKEARQGRIV